MKGELSLTIPNVAFSNESCQNLLSTGRGGIINFCRDLHRLTETRVSCVHGRYFTSF